MLHTFLALVYVLAAIVFPNVAYAGGTTIKVNSVSASPGDSVNVPVVVEGNPGILGATIEVSYDAGLTLTGASNGEALSTLTMTKPGSFASPCRFTWDGMELSADGIRDGQVLLLTFKVADDAEAGKDLAINVSGDAGAVLDGDLNAIDVTYVSGVVSVMDYIPGDLDGDKLVNSRDVIFARRHIVGGYEQTINVAAADVDDNLSVNSADVILMRRYITGGYGVVLKRSRLGGGSGSGSGGAQEQPGTEPHNHTPEAVAAKNPTCTEDGNIAYWHCTGCDKYYSDAGCTAEIALADTSIVATGHSPVVDAAVAPTQTCTGLTEGSHCEVCGTVLREQQVVPKLEMDEYYITYDVANGDSYLAGLSITNPNKTSYYEGDSFKLSNLSVDGYRFLGWYDGAGDDATKITRINADTAEDLELYAHWQAIQYQVQFESDVFIDTNSATYTVGRGLALPTPKLSNYIFAGWSDANGSLYGKRIPAGTTGDITLSANWTSERNKTYTNPNPSNPVICEEKVAFDGDGDHDVILFAYEIGRIENVPLYTIKDFGRISEGGVQRSEQLTYNVTTSQETAETVSNVVAKATTNSSNWTLSSGWNETTSVTEEWCEQHGVTREEAETICKSDSSNWNVSNSKYGSKSTSSSATSVDGWTNQVKVNASESGSITVGNKVSGELSASITQEDTFGWNVGGNVGYSAGGAGGVEGGINGGVNGNSSTGRNVGAKIGAEESASASASNSHGVELGGTQTHSGTSSSSSSSTSGWNNTSSYGGSSTTSKSNTVSTAVSDIVSQKTGYGKSYARSGSETQGLATSTTDSATDSYTSAVTFNTATGESVTSSWSTAATKDGWHRWVVAGTAHVFGVVGYDMNTKSFFVYTYSIMDDSTYEFEDYSNTTSDFNDNENGVISFEVPYDEVMEVVSDRVYSTDGLKVDLETGTVVGYTGEDTCVCIPEYYNAGHGDNVKITGIAPNVFAGNTDIVTVLLSDYITEIPDGAFEGCTSLAFVGGNGVTSIGASAFAGCTSLEDCGVYSQVTHLGGGAFAGADHLYVNAANPQVACAAIAAGAKSLQLNLRFLEHSEDVLSDVEFSIPSSIDYFELNGNERNFNGLRIISDAKETTLNKVNINGTKARSVQLSSQKLALNQTSVTAPGIAVMLTADSLEAVFNQSSITSPGIALAITSGSARVGLRGTTTVSSTGTNATVCRDLSLYETATDVVGKLSVPQRLLVCGGIDGMGYLQCDNVETIDEATFNALLKTTTVFFDAGKGTCAEASREIAYGTAIGELPVPTRDYCDFEGWYLKDTNQHVTAETVLPIGQDLTLSARWKEHWTTEIPDGRYSVSSATDASYSLDSGVLADEIAGKQPCLFNTNFTAAQQFKFTQNDDGSYRIAHLAKGLSLEAAGTNQYGHPYIQLAVDSASDSQKWFIEPTEDGFYSFRNKGNGQYVDVWGNQMADYATVGCHPGNGSAAQKFSVQKVKYGLYERGYSWGEAKTLCEQMGGHLATITSDDEQAQINSILTARLAGTDAYKNYYWLGGYREGNLWKWVTGESFLYTNWAPGQPDSSADAGGEDKLMIWRNVEPGNPQTTLLKWNDLNDNVSNYNSFYSRGSCGFIIEWEDAEFSMQMQGDDRESNLSEVNLTTQNETPSNYIDNQALDADQSDTTVKMVEGHDGEEGKQNDEGTIEIGSDSVAASEQNASDTVTVIE